MAFAPWLYRRIGTEFAHPRMRKGGDNKMSVDYWEFYLDARGLWCWRRTHVGKNITSDSKRCFPTRRDCIADAIEHGYVDEAARRKRVAAPRPGTLLQDPGRPGAADR
jgi:hypothetical protein